jgi:hypothetical protein
MSTKSETNQPETKSQATKRLSVSDVYLVFYNLASAVG